jgi:hypothetical protein
VQIAVGFLSRDRFRGLQLKDFAPRAQLEVVHPEFSPMIRGLGLSFVVVLSIGPASPAQAQKVADPYRRGAAAAYGDSPYRIEPFGGFGLETMQTPFVGTVVLDRFGLVHGSPLAQPSRGVRVARPRGKASGAASTGRAARVEHQLPTGSLNWAGAGGVVLYSPALRYQNYGGGYGRGPYGSIDCGMMYKGWSLGR